VEDRVVGMTFSEFGRRIKSNASRGTDHGTAAPQFIFGSKVNASVIGSNPTIPVNATVNDNIAMQYDFRWVYASILKDWFGASPTELQSVLFNNTQTLPIILPSAALGVKDRSTLPTEYTLLQNYPNPFNPSTTITYEVPKEEFVTLTVYDEAGKEVLELFHGVRARGRYSESFNAAGLASGVYYYRINAGGFVQTKKMLLLK
jgi:hypothetical protein